MNADQSTSNGLRKKIDFHPLKIWELNTNNWPVLEIQECTDFPFMISKKIIASVVASCRFWNTPYYCVQRLSRLRFLLYSHSSSNYLLCLGFLHKKAILFFYVLKIWSKYLFENNQHFPPKNVQKCLRSKIGFKSVKRTIIFLEPLLVKFITLDWTIKKKTRKKSQKISFHICKIISTLKKAGHRSLYFRLYKRS